MRGLFHKSDFTENACGAANANDVGLVPDIEGSAKMVIANERVEIPHADALLKITDGRKRLDIFKVRDKYDNYRLPP